MGRLNWEDFWFRVEKLPGDGCWLYSGASGGGGYGNFGDDLAHRYAWKMCYGPIPPGVQILHKCDVRACVRPSHLFDGSIRDNMLDKVAKGRGLNGQRHGRAKLQDKDIPIIRQMIADRKGPLYISKVFGVSPSAIKMIGYNINWRHIK